MHGPGIGLWLALALAVPQDGPPASLQPQEAEIFARATADLADKVAAQFVRPVKSPDLLVAGMAAVYEAAGKEMPKDIRDRLAASEGAGTAYRTLVEARTAIGHHDSIAGMRAFVIAAEGFAKATDPYGGLVWQRTSQHASSDAEFGLGFELEGATGAAWLAYLLEVYFDQAQGVRPAKNVPRPPVGVPWVVRRVLPGSPAARAGLRVGDAITHLDGEEVTTSSNPPLFRRLASGSAPDGDGSRPAEAFPVIQLRLRRAGTDRPVTVKVPRNSYSPGSVFGVYQKADGSWDYFIDRQAKIGYIRVGAIESPASAEFERAVASLLHEGATGIVLDLRWCPGGYAQPTVRIAGAFLPAGKTIATIETRHINPNQRQPYVTAGEVSPESLKIPLVVLVNGETTGGGEMIAAALQDHGRATIVGSRTFGKANMMSFIDTAFPGLGYRVSTGYALRPSGKHRHRHPDSKPTDDWGVRPDKGFAAPLTPDLSARVRAEAERQTIRPPGDRLSLPFDDPLSDPQKLMAVRFLKEKIESAEQKKKIDELRKIVPFFAFR